MFKKSIYVNEPISLTLKHESFMRGKLSLNKVFLALILFLSVKSMVAQQNDFTVQIATGINASFSKINTGYYDNSKDEITLSGGGSGGLDFCFGYNFNRKLEWLNSIGFKSSNPEIENVEFDLMINVIQSSLKYCIVGSFKRKLYVGGGIAYYYNPSLILKGSNVPGGDNSAYYYNNSLSPMLLISYHRHFSPRFFFLFDISSSFNRLSLNKIIVNDKDVLIEDLPNHKINNFKEINASGIAFFLGLGFYI